MHTIQAQHPIRNSRKEPRCRVTTESQRQSASRRTGCNKVCPVVLFSAIMDYQVQELLPPGTVALEDCESGAGCCGQ